MPVFEFTAPDGKIYEINGPEGSTQEEAFQVLQAQLAGQAPQPGPQPAPAPPGAAPPGPGAPATPQVAAPIAGPAGGPPAPAPGAPAGAGEARYGGLTEQEFEQGETARLMQEQMNRDSGAEKFWAGAGQSVASTGRGIRQLWNYATGDKEELAQLQQQEEEARRRDAPLLATGAGRGGQIVGHVAQAAIPVGAGAKAATTAGKIGLNMGLGAGMAALAPTVEGESRGQNALVGGAIGGLIPGAGRAVSLVNEAKGTALRAVGRALGGGGATNAEIRALAQESAREAGNKTIGEIMKRVQLPMAPLRSELGRIRGTYAKDLPRTIRKGLDQYVTLADRKGKLVGEELARARTMILRETSRAAQSTKAGSGIRQTALEDLRRVLDNGADKALKSMPRTWRDRLFGDPSVRLREARAQVRTGRAPEKVAPYKRAAQRATVEALRRPGPKER